MHNIISQCLENQTNNPSVLRFLEKGQSLHLPISILSAQEGCQLSVHEYFPRGVHSFQLLDHDGNTSKSFIWE